MQPQSELSRWFQERTGGAKGRIRKVMAVALARKLLVALWRYQRTGVVPAGAADHDAAGRGDRHRMSRMEQQRREPRDPGVPCLAD